MRPAEPEFHPRLRFPHAGANAFGPGKADLLVKIASTGSILRAAREMDMSYQRAWTLVRDMNGLFRKPLVTASRGGGNGGGALLTPLGREILSRYRRMESACRAATRRDWQFLQGQLRG